MKNVILLIGLLLYGPVSSQTLAQPGKLEITIHSRVDTTQKEVKEVIQLWINYLTSQPDIIYDNPYWNIPEKLRYKDFDFSRAYLYPFSSKQLLSYYQPTILSIEKEGEYYGLRTLFSAEGLEGEYRKSNPWCITKLYAVKENNKWKLKNALPVVTENWSRKTFGKITFIYPPEHKFDEELAIKANEFCNQIASEFRFSDWKPFDFYITPNGDALGKLLNFDFSFTGYSTGIGMNENRILLSGLGSEFYPHEFIHLIVPKFERHGIIEEGFATWKGGAMEKTFDERAKMLANEIFLNDSITFTDILNKKWGWQYAAFYTTGAILCHAAYTKGGVAFVNKLLETSNDDEALVETICLLFEIKKQNLNSFWRSEVLKFKK